MRKGSNGDKKCMEFRFIYQNEREYVCTLKKQNFTIILLSYLFNDLFPSWVTKNRMVKYQSAFNQFDPDRALRNVYLSIFFFETDDKYVFKARNNSCCV